MTGHLRAIPDPLGRALAARALMAELARVEREASGVLTEAVLELLEAGSQHEVAALLGISQPRVGQITRRAGR